MMRQTLVVTAMVMATIGVHAEEQVPMLYAGATFITMDPALPTAEAILVEGGRIRKVFAHAPGAPPRGAGMVDLKGGVVFPGLHDAHFHVAGTGEAEQTLDLTGTRSAQEIIARLAARITGRKEPFVVGRGWDQNDWDCKDAKPPCGGTMPTKELLDEVAPGVPVILWRIDGHAAWVSSAAIARAVKGGATALQKGGRDPSGGRILRDAKGDASGILVDTAMDLVTVHLPKPTLEVIRERVRLGTERAARAGLTAVHDMGTEPAELEALYALDRAGELPLRVFVYLNGMAPEAAELLPAGGPRQAEGRVEIRGVKLYADGALGSRGAALLQPYSDEPSTSGLLVTEPKVLEEKARQVSDRGFQVAVHAIGDRGNREALALFSRLGPKARALRHRVEHAQVVDPADWGAFKTLNVVASMQPTHCTSDMPWAEARLGKDRLKGAYAWKGLRKAGAMLAFGSDAPVESEDPRWGLYAALTRMSHDGRPEGGWQPHERLDMDEALNGFTSGAAWAVHREAELGVIKAGALADLTWLDGDPTKVEPAKVLTMKVRGTMVGGELVRRWP